MTAARQPVLDFISHSPDQTRGFGALLGRTLDRGSVVLVSGPIGAGKTALIQGIGHGLGVETEVRSPTFTLVVEHRAKTADGQPVNLYHVDFYRIEDGITEVEDLGFDEYLDDPDSILVIEWPQRARGILPPEYLLVELQHIADTKRRILLIPHGNRYDHMARTIRSEVSGGS
ncbi:MAG: tRNA (adenosine(37)-N6)-threonylcarbamoyltransferase complex ATPase subunit type 1 TsaE [Chloroflexota bacterium]